jgi:hypothetical protein
VRKLITFLSITFFATCESFADDLRDENADEKNSYYVKAKSYSTTPESDPPGYVKQLDQTGIKGFEKLNWIDAGLNVRSRFEHRRNDFRRSDDRTDNPILWRTQAYLGIKNIIDPLRLAIELQDSRRYNSKFPAHTRDVNNLDIFQAYAELHFDKPRILDRPISLRFGRMAFEAIDRKLISRDTWGNTGTNFDGFRAIFGSQQSDWQIDSFALQPMVKETTESDQRNQDIWLYGGILNWRRWSDIITLQPFYLQLNQKESANASKYQVNSPGLRLYGLFGNSGFDYDAIGVYQFGQNGNEDQRAYGYSTELGYRFSHKSKPRFAINYAYASGDKNPYDSKNQRFERFYGFNRPWSNNNHIEWENLKTFKNRLTLKPNKKLKVEGSYSYYWLASKTDLWSRGNLQDKSGNSGDFIGRDLDLRFLHETTENLSIILGYAHFIPGNFTKNVSGRTQNSDFIYLELTVSLF